jgi:hypothetical protein
LQLLLGHELLGPVLQVLAVLVRTLVQILQ